MLQPICNYFWNSGRQVIQSSNEFVSSGRKLVFNPEVFGDVTSLQIVAAHNRLHVPNIKIFEQYSAGHNQANGNQEFHTRKMGNKVTWGNDAVN